jgi:hypothetical protein
MAQPPILLRLAMAQPAPVEQRRMDRVKLAVFQLNPLLKILCAA